MFELIFGMMWLTFTALFTFIMYTIASESSSQMLGAKLAIGFFWLR